MPTEVTQEKFDNFLAQYPNELEKNFDGIRDQTQYNDWSNGKVWPESVVAFIKVYDKPYTYFIIEE